MKIYKTNEYVIEIAKSSLERVKGYRAKFEAMLKEPGQEFSVICGGFHGSLDCAIRAMEHLLEDLKEVDENEHV